MNVKKVILFFLSLVFLLPTSGLMAQENDGEVLVQINRCYACHHESNTLIGPPYLAIAARHGQRREVMVDVLVEKIRRGGGGNWGIVPMVPNEHVSEEDARTIARWILSLND